MPVQCYPESSALSPTLPIGQIVEVHESYYTWFKELSCSLQRGALLTIDYGGSTTEVYRGKRSGTLRAFFQHQRLEGMEIYRRPGQQDLTADVNFDDLRRQGAALGFDEIGYTTQRDFVQKWYPGALKRDLPTTRSFGYRRRRHSLQGFAPTKNAALLLSKSLMEIRAIRKTSHKFG